MTTAKFQIGKTYQMLFIGDADLRPQFVCVKRTDKTVTLKSTHETLNGSRLGEVAEHKSLLVVQT